MSDALPHVDLNALVHPVATVTLDEETYDVLPVQGNAMQIFEEIVRESREGNGPSEEQAERYLNRARGIVFAVAPTIPKTRVNTMTVAQLMKIAELSMSAVKKVQAVRDAAGKGGGSTKKGRRTTSGRR